MLTEDEKPEVLRYIREYDATLIKYWGRGPLEYDDALAAIAAFERGACGAECG